LTRHHPNQPTYTKDAAGLYLNVARLMAKRKLNKLKLRDIDTAARLGITAAELVTLQDQLNAEGQLSCRRLANQTVYRFTSDFMGPYGPCAASA
jgi:hypothetical protein